MIFYSCASLPLSCRKHKNRVRQMPNPVDCKIVRLKEPYPVPHSPSLGRTGGPSVRQIRCARERTIPVFFCFLFVSSKEPYPVPHSPSLGRTGGPSVRQVRCARECTARVFFCFFFVFSKELYSVPQHFHPRRGELADHPSDRFAVRGSAPHGFSFASFSFS